MPLNTVTNGRPEDVKQDTADEQNAATAAEAADAVADTGGDSVVNDNKNHTTVPVHIANCFCCPYRWPAPRYG